MFRSAEDFVGVSAPPRHPIEIGADLHGMNNQIGQSVTKAANTLIEPTTIATRSFSSHENQIKVYSTPKSHQYEPLIMYTTQKYTMAGALSSEFLMAPR